MQDNKIDEAHLTTVVKTFPALSGAELYEILKARNEVFVVEQKICYPDMDDIDYRSVHVYITDHNEDVLASDCQPRPAVKGYLRVFEERVQGVARIGRVLTRDRGRGLGAMILSEGIRVAKEQFKANEIVLDAQQYCIGFYEKAGFRQESEPFIEDGIPHVRMRLVL